MTETLAYHDNEADVRSRAAPPGSLDLKTPIRQRLAMRGVALHACVSELLRRICDALAAQLARCHPHISSRFCCRLHQLHGVLGLASPVLLNDRERLDD